MKEQKRGIEMGGGGCLLGDYSVFSYMLVAAFLVIGGTLVVSKL
jgi:hypothetical protein